MMDRKRRRTSLVLRVDAKCRWSLVFERKIAGNQKAVAEDAHLDSDPGHCQISRRKLSRPYRTTPHPIFRVVTGRPRVREVGHIPIGTSTQRWR